MVFGRDAAVKCVTQNRSEHVFSDKLLFYICTNKYEALFQGGGYPFVLIGNLAQNTLNQQARTLAERFSLIGLFQSA